MTTKTGFWSIFGPGLLMASAAIGGSHLISSTQAGALYGWQLAIIIILANVFKYPFFRFGTDYTYKTGQSLVVGYAKVSRAYLWIYFALCAVSGIISTGAVGLLTAVILGLMLPFDLPISALTVIIMGSSWVMLVAGHYKVLDGVTKWIVSLLTIATLVSVVVAAGKVSPPAPDFVVPNAWTLAALPFIVSLMGWMPAPVEFSAITSIWTERKIAEDNPSHKIGMLDFNIGFILSSVLALAFLALGVFVQYGSGTPIDMQGAGYVKQLVDMYANTIGSWSYYLVAFIAFLCMYGTTITCADGYGRANGECLRLLQGKETASQSMLTAWYTHALGLGLVLVLFFGDQLGALLKFAMISAFVTAPIFAYLNYALVKSTGTMGRFMNAYSILGIVFLLGFTLLFLVNFFFM